MNGEYYHLEFLAMLALASIGTRLPLVGLPLRWLEVFFHEISHGLAALITFGRPVRLDLTWGGAGCCTSRGGWRIFVLPAGYLGAVGWGMLIYFAGVYLGQGAAYTLLGALLALLIMTIIVLIRDVVSFIIMLILCGLFILPLQFPDVAFFNELLRFMGMAVAVNGLKSPLYLIDGKKEGDGADLARLTWIPEGIWILLWFAWGVVGLLYMWQVPLAQNQRWLTFLPFLHP